MDWAEPSSEWVKGFLFFGKGVVGGQWSELDMCCEGSDCRLRRQRGEDSII